MTDYSENNDSLVIEYDDTEAAPTVTPVFDAGNGSWTVQVTYDGGSGTSVSIALSSLTNAADNPFDTNAYTVTAVTV